MLLDCVAELGLGDAIFLTDEVDTFDLSSLNSSVFEFD